jgi:hypothetical protein
LLSHLGPMLSHLGPMLSHLGPMLSHLGLGEYMRRDLAMKHDHLSKQVRG